MPYIVHIIMAQPSIVVEMLRSNYIISKTNEISFNTHLSCKILCTCVLCNFVISSLAHHVRPDDGLIEKKGRNVLSVF